MSKKDIQHWDITKVRDYFGILSLPNIFFLQSLMAYSLVSSQKYVEGLQVAREVKARP